MDNDLSLTIKILQKISEYHKIDSPVVQIPGYDHEFIMKELRFLIADGLIYSPSIKDVAGEVDRIRDIVILPKGSKYLKEHYSSQ